MEKLNFDHEAQSPYLVYGITEEREREIEKFCLNEVKDIVKSGEGEVTLSRFLEKGIYIFSNNTLESIGITVKIIRVVDEIMENGVEIDGERYENVLDEDEELLLHLHPNMTEKEKEEVFKNVRKFYGVEDDKGERDK
jgi:hypothetical protein